MVRTLIAIPDDKLKQLDRMAKRHKKSRAQLVREAVDIFLKKNAREEKETWQELVKRTAGLWKHKNVDGLAYERKLREEWDDR